MKISIIWIVCTSSVMVKAGLSDLGIRRKVERIKKLWGFNYGCAKNAVRKQAEVVKEMHKSWGQRPCFNSSFSLAMKHWPSNLVSPNPHVQNRDSDHLATYYSVLCHWENPLCFFLFFFRLSGLFFVFGFLCDLELACQTKRKQLRFDGNCIEYIYQFGKDWHLYDTDSPIHYIIYFSI